MAYSRETLACEHVIPGKEFRHWKNCAAAAGLLLIFLFAGTLYGRQAGDAASSSVNADQLAREVVQNELKAQDGDKSLWSYREIQREKNKTQLIAVVQTRDGEIHRLLAINGMPLNAKEKRMEDQRLEKVAANPKESQARHKNQEHDAQQARRLLQMLPAAFHYEQDGVVQGFMRLTFKPNPSFHSTDRESAVFRHMDGTMLVDARQKRLVGLNGRLATEVKFGGGLLGHLDRGGTFSVRKKDVGAGHWEMTLLDVHMNGKALFFKTIAVRENEAYSNFQRVPDNTSLGKAVQLLKNMN